MRVPVHVHNKHVHVTIMDRKKKKEKEIKRRGDVLDVPKKRSKEIRFFANDVTSCDSFFCRGWPLRSRSLSRMVRSDASLRSGAARVHARARDHAAPVDVHLADSYVGMHYARPYAPPRCISANCSSH